jgi:peptide/nickel transport system substrate-binding protein
MHICHLQPNPPGKSPGDIGHNKIYTPIFKLLVLAAVLLLCCCQPEESRDPNILAVGLEAGPTNLDPRYATDAYSTRIDQLLFNSLFRIDDAFNIVPELAQSWEMQDERQIVVYLKKGVYFHHGAELTAADVKFTFDSIMDPSGRSPKRAGLKEFASVEALDRYTVRFQLKQPFAPALSSLVQGIVPKDEAAKRGAEFSGVLFGTGPFRLREYKRDQHIVLEAFDNYFEGHPPLDGIRFKIVPDSTVRVLELKHGDLDLLINSVEPDMIPMLEKSERIKVTSSSGTSFSYMGFNMNDPILKDLRVRKAIAHAINRGEIIKFILRGYAEPATGVLAPAHWAYEKDVSIYDFDPDRARELLDLAGYPDPDGPGENTRFTLTFKTSTNELRRRIAEVIQEQLSRVGIGIEIHANEWGTFFGDIKRGNFQLYTLTWVGITEPDIFYYIFNSDAFPPEGANRGRYLNGEIDRLTVDARLTLDNQRRHELYSQIQKIVANDLPYVNLWYTVNVAVSQDSVQNFHLSPAADFYSLRRVSIER